MHAARLTRLVILPLILIGVLLAACQPQGFPGAALLTPPSLRSPVVPTNSPTSAPTHTSVVITPSPSEESPSPTLEATQTASRTATRTSRPSRTPTWDGTPSLTPTRTLVPTNTRPPTRTPTNTPTATPPLAFMRISRPGPYSKVSSPFRIEAVISPGDDGLVHLEIIGEDGRYVLRNDLDFRNYRERHLAIGPEISFEMSAGAETSRLQLFTLDEFERTIYLTSVELVLLQLGDDEIFLPGSQLEPFIVRSPRPGAEISGGSLTVTGLARLINDSPLIIELIDEENRVLGSASLDVSLPYGDLSHIPFSTQIEYEIEEPTSARLTLRQESTTRIPGTVFLSSLLLTLQP